MRTEISFSPSFAMATIHLEPGESVSAEAGAMMAMSPSVEIATSTKGGIMKGLRRSVLGGESFFLNTFEATGPDAHVVVAPALVGDEGVGYEVHKAGGWKSSILGGEDLVVRVTGPGRAYIQTRSPNSFIDWLVPKLPTQRS